MAVAPVMFVGGVIFTALAVAAPRVNGIAVVVSMPPLAFNLPVWVRIPVMVVAGVIVTADAVVAPNVRGIAVVVSTPPLALSLPV